MIKRLLLALAAVLTVSAGAAEAPSQIPWHSVPHTAQAVARAQQKFLLVYYRANCQNCNARSDEMLEKAGTDEVFVRMLDAYLPLRVVDGETSHPITDELKARYKGPALAIYDGAGVQLAVFPNLKLDWTKLAEDILRFRPLRDAMAQSVGLRSAGNTAAADFVTGHVLLGAGHFDRAALHFGLAAKAFRGAGDTESEQLAEIAGGRAWYGVGQLVRGRRQVADVLNKPASDYVAAEGHLALGAMSEASAVRGLSTGENVPTARTTPGGRRDRGTSAASIATTKVVPLKENRRALAAVLASYRKAYELAPVGSSTLEAARAALARLDDQPLPPKAGASSKLRIVPPARRTVTGDADFHVEAQPGIARVDFYLDETKVATQNAAPFRATIDVGPTPRVRAVKARAYDAKGNAVGDAVVTINDRVDSFFVTIVSPATEEVRGATEVELDVRVPPGRTLRALQLSWNDTPVATLTEPPYRTRFDASDALGYLRAVATLDDGTVAETARVYNAGGVSENVEVGAVTVIASVVDRNGERVKGLGAADFAIEDQGERVVPSLRSSEEEPVTIGVAIDSSASMTGQQLYVLRAAADFLTRALRSQDEAFVVAFDTAARLAHPRSRDVTSLRNAVMDLLPSGGTSIFDGVTFALQQFQGIPGKKALVVFSDGREGTSSASAKECLRLARSVGVPVYVIVPPGGERLGNALREVADSTGGLLLYATKTEEFGTTFDRLADEIRGQYVLSFTRPASAKAGEWRVLRVAVPQHDATVRTIQGYRAN